MKLLNILTESENLLNYVWRWLNTGQRGVATKIPHSFLLMLAKQGYKKQGTIYRSITIDKENFRINVPSGYWRKYIWENYKGTYSSFTKTLDGAVWFAKAMTQTGDKLHIIIKQNSDYLDIDQYFQDNKEYYEPNYDYNMIAGEIDITKECVATLDPNFQIEKIFSA